MKTIQSATLHATHQLPFAELPGAGAIGKTGVMRMRFDGRSTPAGPQIFAIVPLDDLKAISDRLHMPERPGTGLPGSDIFFMKTPDGPSLYIDTDRHERLFLEILDEACDAGIPTIESQGDLRLICRAPSPFKGVDMDVDPPKMAAYEANGFEHLPIEVGYAALPRTILPEIAFHDPELPQP